ncbi:hypothetical protein [Microbacterium sp. bgisy207]|uniref:hypothetical protein n=1 Tax=Microbacterium sp. bgisy207 TaxID=3413800 RepID=UPI003EBEBC57
MPPALAVALEIYTWIGLGATVLLGMAALVAWVADGSWVAVRAVVTTTPGSEVVRWFDDSGVLGEAPLPSGASVHDEQVDLWARLGRHDTVRVSRTSPLVRSLARLTVGFAALALAGLVVSTVLLFLEG